MSIRELRPESEAGIPHDEKNEFCADFHFGARSKTMIIRDLLDTGSAEVAERAAETLPDYCLTKSNVQVRPTMPRPASRVPLPCVFWNLALTS